MEQILLFIRVRVNEMLVLLMLGSQKFLIKLEKAFHFAKTFTASLLDEVSWRS